jgi:hypothetical protein
MIPKGLAQECLGAGREEGRGVWSKKDWSGFVLFNMCRPTYMETPSRYLSEGIMPNTASR